MTKTAKENGNTDIFFNNGKNNEKFTRKELEYSDFGWVFDCPGVEVEEVK